MKHIEKYNGRSPPIAHIADSCYLCTRKREGGPLFAPRGEHDSSAGETAYAPNPGKGSEPATTSPPEIIKAPTNSPEGENSFGRRAKQLTLSINH